MIETLTACIAALAAGGFHGWCSRRLGQKCRRVSLLAVFPLVGWATHQMNTTFEVAFPLELLRAVAFLFTVTLAAVLGSGLSEAEQPIGAARPPGAGPSAGRNHPETRALGVSEKECSLHRCDIGPEGGEWVPVSERHPRDGGTVATWDGETVRWEYWNPDTGRFHPNRGWQARVGRRQGEVTHWYELPGPPP